MQRNFVFTSESVTRGHPDKLCDVISDAVVGHLLRQDPFARVIAECATSTGILFVSVKYTADATLDVANTARRVIADVGYRDMPFDARTCTVLTSLIPYDLRDGEHVDEAKLDEAGIERMVARDQATVVGFACTHTDAYMPAPVWLANRIARRLDIARATELGALAPDGKVHVGVEFRDGRPARVYGITLTCAQREEGKPSPSELEASVRARVIEPVFEHEAIRPDGRTQIAINPEGPIVLGGPHRHAGLTGHKGSSDLYGGFARESASTLSGKDPTRIDRVGAYAARYAAKNVVAAGLAQQCEVQLSYQPGLAAPVSLYIETFGTGVRSDDEIARRVSAEFDFRLAAVIRDFRMRALPRLDAQGFYPKLAAYGQVGRPELDLPWERIDRADALR
jgi:S-adenosylmethionine synthetase